MKKKGHPAAHIKTENSAIVGFVPRRCQEKLAHREAVVSLFPCSGDTSFQRSFFLHGSQIISLFWITTDRHFFFGKSYNL